MKNESVPPTVHLSAIPGSVSVEDCHPARDTDKVVCVDPPGPSRPVIAESSQLLEPKQSPHRPIPVSPADYETAGED